MRGNSILDAQTLGFVWYGGGIERGQGMGAVRKFWGIFRKGKEGGEGGVRDWKRIRDRKSNTQHQAPKLTVYPISFSTSFSHEI